MKESTDKVPLYLPDLRDTFARFLPGSGIEIKASSYCPEYIMVVGTYVGKFMDELGSPLNRVVNPYLPAKVAFLHPKQARFLLEELDRINKENEREK